MFPLPEIKGTMPFFTFKEKEADVWSASKEPVPTTVVLPGTSMESGDKLLILPWVELDPQSLKDKLTVSALATARADANTADFMIETESETKC
jgi:hypothetical protein